MRISRLTLAAAGLALPAILTAQAGAASGGVVSNGSFSGGLSGWQLSGGPQYVSAEVQAGAAVVTNKYDGSGDSFYGIGQCLPVDGGETYTISVDARVPLDAPESASAGIYLNFDAGLDCDTDALGGGHQQTGDSPATRGTWNTLVFDLQAPADAKAVYLRVLAVKEQPGSEPDDATVEFDNVSMTLAGEPQPTPEDPDPGTPAPTATPTVTTPTPAAETPSPTTTPVTTPTPAPEAPSPTTTPVATQPTSPAPSATAPATQTTAPAPPNTGTGTADAGGGPLEAVVTAVAALAALTGALAAGARMTRR